MTKMTWLSWSSGKDSAWALHVLRQDPEIEVAGLFCTVNREFERVAMHAVRVALLEQQAEAVGLPIRADTDTESLYQRRLRGRYERLRLRVTATRY